MKKFSFVLIALIISASLTVSGCSSAQKKLSEEVKGVQAKVDTLETRVESVETKQAETERIAMEQSQRFEALQSERVRTMSRSNISIKEKSSSKDKARIKDIQTCLKNAGFYQGEIDGIKGRKTRSAIRKFQSANGLTADGIVGKRTWEALSKYMSGGASSASAAAPEEEASTK